MCFSNLTQKLPTFIQQLNLSSSPRWAVFVRFSSSHIEIWKKNTKNAHYLSQQICGQILCFFPIHPLWFGKKHKNCPLSGRGINAFVHGGQFLCDFPAHRSKYYSIIISLKKTQVWLYTLLFTINQFKMVNFSLDTKILIYFGSKYVLN